MANPNKTLLKKLLIPLLVMSSFISLPGCKKDNSCREKSPDSEVSQMMTFANANGMNAQAGPGGIYYEIIEMGSGLKASANSKIAITYTGKLLNGQTFDENLTPNTEPWLLSSLIKGWILGIPLINEGGHIKLLIPSSLAYGCAPYYTIPANSVLYFDIHLVTVK